jgi:hypothetical protein
MEKYPTTGVEDDYPRQTSTKTAVAGLDLFGQVAGDTPSVNYCVSAAQFFLFGADCYLLAI